MERTRQRPLPAGRTSRPAALAFGAGTGAAGLGLSAVALPLLATGLIALTIAVYLLAYTPLKKRSPWCTHVGAIPGAIPPLIGWAAATGSIGGLGVWLALIVLLWQMPHFFAIAWLCQSDYEKGGLRVLSVSHPDGRRLTAENYLYLFLLFPVCLAPTLAGQTGWVYGISSIVLNLLFLFEGVRFAATVRSGGRTGNRLFVYSLLYLPVLLVFLLFDRTPVS
jgi:protoheme IX farnesyltransferase